MSTRLDCLDLVPRLRGARWWGGGGRDRGVGNVQLPAVVICCLFEGVSD